MLNVSLKIYTEVKQKFVKGMSALPLCNVRFGSSGKSRQLSQFFANFHGYQSIHLRSCSMHVYFIRIADNSVYVSLSRETKQCILSLKHCTQKVTDPSCLYTNSTLPLIQCIIIQMVIIIICLVLSFVI